MNYFYKKKISLRDTFAVNEYGTWQLDSCSVYSQSFGEMLLLQQQVWLCMLPHTPRTG